MQISKATEKLFEFLGQMLRERAFILPKLHTSFELERLDFNTLGALSYKR